MKPIGARDRINSKRLDISKKMIKLLYD